jgi:hypothetical protein
LGKKSRGRIVEKGSLGRANGAGRWVSLRFGQKRGVADRFSGEKKNQEDGGGGSPLKSRGFRVFFFFLVFPLVNFLRLSVNFSPLSLNFSPPILFTVDYIYRRSVAWPQSNYSLNLFFYFFFENFDFFLSFIFLKASNININSTKKINNHKIYALKIKCILNTFKNLNSFKMILKMLKTM